jgi:chromosome segregation ATPase
MVAGGLSARAVLAADAALREAERHLEMLVRAHRAMVAERDELRRQLGEVEQLCQRLLDAEQQASNAITWQAAMVRAEDESKRFRAALTEIKHDCGAVCPEFETCDHAACAASYAAWHLADVALKEAKT